MGHIAIVGIACRLPGGCNSPDAFWAVLESGRDAVERVPRTRWDIDAFYDPVSPSPGKMNTTRAGFISDMETFDPAFFGLSPKEAASMDPQQRKFLEVAVESLEDAGQIPSRLRGTDVGVFVGGSNLDYQIVHHKLVGRTCDPYTITGAPLSLVANRLSYAFDLKGPSLAVDTACSSSLVATHVACKSLDSGECWLTIVGGVNAILLPSQMVHFANAGVLSPDGRCKAFDASANGYVRAEGVVALVLKRLDDALSAGDAIYGVIRGSAVNQDGRSDGIMAPVQMAQENAIRAACTDANIDPRRVDYVEAHGTGTRIGDTTEARALGSVYGAARPRENPLRIGSCKSNIGHTEPASGAVSLIKVALMFDRGIIPPSIHFEEAPPELRLEENRLEVATTASPWLRSGEPRVAGVNSFGIGGTNAHVLVEEAPPVSVAASCDADVVPIVLSARSEAHLSAYAARLHDWLLTARADGVRLVDVAHTLALRREHEVERVAFVVESKDELRALLDSYAKTGEVGPSGIRRARPNASGGLVFVFSGQGPQWWGMGQALMRRDGAFRETVERCSAAFAAVAGWSLIDAMTADESSSRIADTAVAQPAIVALQIALAAWWARHGVTPDAVIGHSVGEISAAHVGGALSLEDAMRVIYHRSRLMARASVLGGQMLAAELSAAEARALIAPYAGRVDLAADNGPRSVALAGDGAAISELAEILQAKNVHCDLLRVACAFHSPHMDPYVPSLAEALGDLAPSLPKITIYSTLHGEPSTAESFRGDHWAREMRHSVEFRAAVSRAVSDGATRFLEVGPHPVLSSYVSAVCAIAKRPAVVEHSLNRKQDEVRTLLKNLAALHASGHEVRWTETAAGRGRCIHLPPTPWLGERYWLPIDVEEATRLPGRASGLHRTEHPSLGEMTTVFGTGDRVFQLDLRVEEFPYLADHRVRGAIVLPSAAMVEFFLAAVRTSTPSSPIHLRHFTVTEAIFLQQGAARTIQVALRSGTHGFGELTLLSARTNHGAEAHLHASAEIVAVGASDDVDEAVAGIDLAVLRTACPYEVSVAEIYHALSFVGLDYGPAFRGVQRISRGEREAVADIESASIEPADVARYYVHPTILDSALHVLLAAIPESMRTTTLMLPASFREIRWYRPAGARVVCHARIEDVSAEHLVGSLALYDQEGRLCLAVNGVRLKTVDDTGLAGRLYCLEWDRLPLRALERAAVGVGSTELSKRLQGAFADWARSELPGDHEELLERFEDVCAGFMMLGLQRLGWASRESAGGLAKTRVSDWLGIGSGQAKPFEMAVDTLLGRGYLVETDGRLIQAREVAHDDLLDQGNRLAAAYPGLQSLWKLAASVGSQFDAILQGRSDPLETLFASDANSLESLYRDSAFAGAAINGLIARTVAREAELAAARRPLRVLEVGAGTGGTTKRILQALTHEVDYVFTDIAPALLSRAKERLRDFANVTFVHLDLERHPRDQGFTEGSFDLVVAANVLHATRDLGETVAHLHWLLARGGRLLVWELTRRAVHTDLVFGTTAGWWRFRDDDRRRKHPLIGSRAWIELLEASGFEEAFSTPAAAQTVEAASAHQSLVVATKTGSAAAQSDVPPPLRGTRWLLLAPTEDVGQALKERLRGVGADAVVVVPFDSGEPSEPTLSAHPLEKGSFSHVLERATALMHGAPTGTLHLWSLAMGDQAEGEATTIQELQAIGCRSAVTLVKALVDAQISSGHRLWLVTSGAQTVGDARLTAPVQAPLWGFGRSLAHEHREIQTTLVDLDAARPERHPEDLVELLWTAGTESQLAVRKGRTYGARLAPVPTEEKHDTGPSARVPGSQDNFALASAAPGVLDGLRLQQADRRAPAANEIEIEVLVAGLNFRDLVVAMNLIAGFAEMTDPPGSECVGRVARVGREVRTFREGDLVVALVRVGAFRRFLTTPSIEVVRCPEGLSPQEAVTVPVAFATAYHALVERAQLKAGETVLIHAAAGGVGLAALQIAQDIGAEIICTAGSEAKRAYLREQGVTHVFDSRSDQFVEQIRDLTGGRGVDVILNSLSGALLEKSIGLIAPHGRFVELGKRDLLTNSAIRLMPLAKNATLSVVDVSSFPDDFPGKSADLMRMVFAGIEGGRFRPLPVTVFDPHRISEPFRFMANARHIGKVAVRMAPAGDELHIWPDARRTARIHHDKTHLILGGLGGIGLAVADWLVDEAGATELMLVARSVPSPEQQRRIQRMEAKGARVFPIQADITDPRTLPDVFARLRREHPPLGGVVHAAGSLDDGMLLDMSDARMSAMLAPKVQAAWQLHQLTVELRLDYFLLLSSGASLGGAPAQANYCAANAFLDALAEYRRGRGLPATAIGFGPWAEVGLAARMRAERAHNALAWYGVLSPKLGIRVVADALARELTHVAAFSPNWDEFLRKTPGADKIPFFSKMFSSRGVASRASRDAGASALLLKLRDAPLSERQALLVQYARERLSNITGFPVENLDPEKSIKTMGVDSLMALELKNRFEADLGAVLETSELLRGATISRLAERLLGLAKFEGLAEAGPPAEPVDVPEVVTPARARELLENIDRLPDEQVRALLGILESSRETR